IVSWLQRRRLDDDDLQEEIRAHLAIAADDRKADGADHRSAELASLKDFGNDVRYAIRVLAKSPAFALTVIGVLTLGIGANAAVFTLLKGMALRPLSGIGDSSQLGIIVNESEKGRKGGLSYHDYQYVRDHDHAF